MKFNLIYLLLLFFGSHGFSMGTREIILPGQETSCNVSLKTAGLVTGLGALFLGSQALYYMNTSQCAGDLCLASSLGSTFFALVTGALIKSHIDDSSKTKPVSFEKVTEWLDKSFKSKKSIPNLVRSLRDHRVDSVLDKLQKNRKEYSHVTQKIIITNGGYINRGLYEKGLPAEICQIICVRLFADLKKRKEELATLNLTQEDLKKIIELRGPMKSIRLTMRLHEDNSEHIETAQIINNLDRSYRNQLTKAYLQLRLPHYPWQANS